jgi:hypothetical protein
MKHVFTANQIGWNKDKEIVWFDSSLYTLEEAIAQFKPFQGISKKGYPYTGYEFEGQKYHDYHYLGELGDDEMPRDASDILGLVLKLISRKEK